MRQPTPGPLPLPVDHDDRMDQAERAAEWYLGDPSWAGLLIAAYMNPQASVKSLAYERGES